MLFWNYERISTDMLYLAMAFIVVWALVTGYLLFMSTRQRSQEQELQTLLEMAEKKRTSK